MDHEGGKGQRAMQTDTPKGFTRSMKEETDKEPLQPTPPSSSPEARRRKGTKRQAN